MTRYSASRGIRYTAPPGPDGNRRDADEEGEEAVVSPTADVEADGGARTGDGGLAADD